MPIMTIQITREGTTTEHRAHRGATDLLANVLNKPPGLTFVVVQEMADWGVNGLPVADYRR
jgi:4-oxalocrotonate tautomerase